MSNIDDNNNGINSSQSETAIIGLPRLESVLDDIDEPTNNDETEVTSLTDQIPVSILETYQTQPLDEVDINGILDEVTQPEKLEDVDIVKTNPPKKRRRKRRAKRSNLILPGSDEKRETQSEKVSIRITEEVTEELDKVKIKIYEPLAHIYHETIATEGSIVDQLEYDRVELKDYSKEDLEATIIAPDVSNFFEEEKEEKLKTLITPTKKPRRRRRKQRPTESHELSPTETNIIIPPEISVEQDYIFSNVPENLLTAGLILYNNLTRQMQKDGALRVEHLMAVLGSLAGYSTQAGSREKMINRLKLKEDQVFSVIETVDGSKYYFSDTIDRSLQKDRHSVWYMAATAALKITGKVNCNINEVVSYNIRNLGKKGFGIPRISKNLRTGNLPEYYIKHLWIPIQKGLERFTDNPLDWPVIFGVALQRALIVTKDVLDPNVSLKIAMENAVPSSIMDVKPLNPNEIPEEEDNDLLINKLREEIQIIRKTLEIPGMPDEQRQNLLAELSDKNEQLFMLLK